MKHDYDNEENRFNDLRIIKQASKEKAKRELFAYLKESGVSDKDVFQIHTKCPTLWRLLDE